MSGFFKKTYLKIGYSFGFIEKKKPSAKKINSILYTIGNVKKHNTEIDGLIPQAVEIGDNFISAPKSLIIAHDASLYNHVRKHRVEKVIIGNNVFLGAGAIILPGVKVGDGAIIGAGSIVTKDVEPNTVVFGNPARFYCNVSEYIEKCEQKGVLLDTPPSFEKFFTNELSKIEIAEFQEAYKNKNKNKNV